MAGAGAVGGTLGAMSAPEGESQAAHGALWGGVAAAVAGAVSLFVFDEQERSKAFEQRALQAEAAERELRKAADPKLIGGGVFPVGKSLPDGIKGLVRDSEWRLYSLDRWVQEDEGKLIHQTEMLEFMPGAVVPGKLSGVNKGTESSELKSNVMKKGE